MTTVTISGMECEVERTHYDRNSDFPNHQIIAPAGYHFDSHDAHALECFSMPDVRDRAKSATLAMCKPDCECLDE